MPTDNNMFAKEYYKTSKYKVWKKKMKKCGTFAEDIRTQII